MLIVQGLFDFSGAVFKLFTLYQWDFDMLTKRERAGLTHTLSVLHWRFSFFLDLLDFEFAKTGKWKFTKPQTTLLIFECFSGICIGSVEVNQRESKWGSRKSEMQFIQCIIVFS